MFRPLVVLTAVACLASLGCEQKPIKISQKPTNNSERQSQYFPSRLPIGETNAMVMEMQATDNIIEITRRMAQAIAAQPDWIRSYTQQYSNLPKGESLPYHENFGITEEEYELQGDFLLNTPLTPSVPCTLKVRDEGNGRFIVDILGDPKQFTDMRGLILDATDMSATFDGITTNSWKESASPSTAPYRVDGIAWKTESASPDQKNIKTLFVRVGSNLENGNGILMFRVIHALDGEIRSRGEINIEWKK